MKKSKLAISCLLAASILSPMCAKALTQQEATDIAAASQSQAELTAEQKRAHLVRLRQEIRAIDTQIVLKKSELANDKNMRAITFTITAAGSAVIGYLMFARSDAGMRGLENLFYSTLTAAGTLPFAAMSYSLDKQVKLSIEQIDNLKLQIDDLEKQFNTQLSALN